MSTFKYVPTTDLDNPYTQENTFELTSDPKSEVYPTDPQKWYTESMRYTVNVELASQGNRRQMSRVLITDYGLDPLDIQRLGFVGALVVYPDNRFSVYVGREIVLNAQMERTIVKNVLEDSTSKAYGLLGYADMPVLGEVARVFFYRLPRGKRADMITKGGKLTSLINSR